jgi:hypothetical protein
MSRAVEVARARILAQGGVLTDPKGGPPPGFHERGLALKEELDRQYFVGTPGSRVLGAAPTGALRDLLVPSAEELLRTLRGVR